MRAKLAVLIAAGLWTAALPMLGHHAFSAEFDVDKPLTLTGTVTKVEWQNPHTWFYIDVKDEAGNVTNWGMELASPNLLMRQGWTRNTIKNGDVVTVAGVTGMTVTGADVVPLGKEILRVERLLNEKAGFTPEDDRPPEFMRYEKLPPHNVVWTITDEQLDSVFAWVHEGEEHGVAAD